MRTLVVGGVERVGVPIPNIALLLLLAVTLAGCARAQAVRASANTMIIQAGAAPICGRQGAARVAQETAAIETIRAGYDRYILTGAQAQNNVTVTQLPGSYSTSGWYGQGQYNATTTYQPGGAIVSGSHDQDLTVVMFKDGEPGSQQAIPARDALGPDWQDKVKNGIRTCL